MHSMLAVHITCTSVLDAERVSHVIEVAACMRATVYSMHVHVCRTLDESHDAL